MALLTDAKPDLMATDLPCGASYDPNWPTKVRHGNGTPLSAGRVSVGEVKNDDLFDWRLGAAPRRSLLRLARWQARRISASLEACGFEIRNQIIWRKQGLVIGRGNYHWQHEPCWYAVKKGGKSHWVGDRKQSTVWDIDNASGNGTKDDADTNHGTQKPLDCMRRPINNNSVPGDGICDPFLGSGTTMVACEQSGRVCFGMSVEPEYVVFAGHLYARPHSSSRVIAGAPRPSARLKKPVGKKLSRWPSSDRRASRSTRNGLVRERPPPLPACLASRASRRSLPQSDISEAAWKGEPEE